MRRPDLEAAGRGAGSGAALRALRAFALAAASLLGAFACSEPAPSPPRHLVLVTIDTLRADRLGAYGYARPTSPNLDALAARGVRFDDAIAQAISTPPSHASILTGLDPPRHGLRKLWGERLNPDARTLAEILRAAGFHTAAFVSGLPLRRAVGLDQGFEVYDDELGRSGERSAGETNARVGRWLATVPPGRVFLWVHYFDPHMPYFAPAAARARFHVGKVSPRELAAPILANARGRPEAHVPPEVARLMSDLYDAEVAYADEQLGVLLEMLREARLLDDAVIAVVADHGECLGERGYYFGHWDVWRPTARVPLVLDRPEDRWAGSVVSSTVRTVDIVPTVLSWLGIAVPDGLDGRDLTPLLDGRETQPRVAYTEQLEYFPARAVRTGRWLLAQHDFRDGAGVVGELALYDRSGREPRLVMAPPPGVRERLETALAERARPERALATLELRSSQDVAERLRALGYVVGPDRPGPGEPTSR